MIVFLETILTWLRIDGGNFLDLDRQVIYVLRQCLPSDERISHIESLYRTTLGRSVFSLRYIADMLSEWFEAWDIGKAPVFNNAINREIDDNIDMLASLMIPYDGFADPTPSSVLALPMYNRFVVPRTSALPTTSAQYQVFDLTLESRLPPEVIARLSNKRTTMTMETGLNLPLPQGAPQKHTSAALAVGGAFDVAKPAMAVATAVPAFRLVESVNSDSTLAVCVDRFAFAFERSVRRVLANEASPLSDARLKSVDTKLADVMCQ
jgi:hypothetical protein